MSKGKRKSDPQALQLVLERLRSRSPGLQPFTEADRDLLNKLARTDLIYILEHELGFGPMKPSQKNSVAGMVEWLLTKQTPARFASTNTYTVPSEEKHESSRSVADHSTRARDDTGGGDTPEDRLDEYPPSAGGSCRTPSPVPHTPFPHRQQPTDGVAAAAAAGVLPDDPWLAELHQQLAAAGKMPAAAEHDDNDSDTEADSGWVQSRSVATAPVPSAAQGAAVDTPAGMLSPAAPLTREMSTSQIEELLVQQLLLDIESKPKYRARRSRSSLASFGQQQQQHQMQMQQLNLYQPHQVPQPPLAQPPLIQPHPYHMMVPQQHQHQHQHQQLEQQMRQLGVECLLHDQAVQQGTLAAFPAQPHLVQPPLLGSFQPATWPLPIPQTAAGGAGSSNYGVALAGSPGVHVSGCGEPSSAPTLPGWPQEPWLKCEEAGVGDLGSRPPSEGGAGGSFLRKRDKMLMGAAQEARADTPAWDLLAVEFSGPSADLPTKRMSVELPGTKQVASLPTSFSGRMGSSAPLSRPLPDDLLMQLTCCDDSSNALWQQAPADASQLHTQQPPQLTAPEPQQQPHVGPGGMSQLASKLKTLFRGGKPKSKARRQKSVGAGGSFSVNAAPPDVGRLPSADAVLVGHGGGQVPAVLGGGYPLGTVSGAWSSNPGSLVLSQGPGQQQQMAAPAAADGRLWRSMMNMPTQRQASDPCMMTPATVGGLSWHAERSTLLGQSCHAAAAHSLAQQQQNAVDAAGPLPFGVTASDSHFAQQLEQLRVLYGAQFDDEDALEPAVPAPTLTPVMPAIEEAGTPAAASAGRQGGVDGVWGSLQDPPKPGFVGKLKKALQKESHPSVYTLPALAGGHTEMGGLGVPVKHEQDDDLLLTGRCDGERDLAKTILQWQVGAAEAGLGNSCASGGSWEAQVFGGDFMGLAAHGDGVGEGGMFPPPSAYDDLSGTCNGAFGLDHLQ